MSRGAKIAIAVLGVAVITIVILVVVLLTKFEGRQILGVPKEIVGAIIFAVASLTDWADGYLARRRKQVTGFGQWMDPLADKLLVTAALISLVQLGLAPAWMVAVILGREFSVTVLRSIAYARGLSLPASPLEPTRPASDAIQMTFPEPRATIAGNAHIQRAYHRG